MEFSEACCEVDFILANLNPDDKKKIPQTVIEFFKENKSLFYNVNLTTSKPLAEQNLKDETKAFLQIINYKYFANENEKEQFSKMFKEEDNITDVFLKNESVNNKIVNEEKQEIETAELAVYKENKILTFLKNILSFFRK